MIDYQNDSPINNNITAPNIRKTYCVIIICFIIFRLFKYFETEYFIIWFDSAQYAAAAFSPIWSKLFWADGIPPLYPFFLKYFMLSSDKNILHLLSEFSYYPDIIKGIELLDNYPYFLVKDNFNIVSASLFQLFFSIFSCVIFALSFSSVFQNYYVRLASLLSVLFLGMESSIVIWDKHILTESISISVLLLTISLLINVHLITRKTIFLILFVFMLTFISLIKITNNYFLLILIPFFLFHFYRSSYQHKFNYIFIITTLLTLFTLNQFMLFNGDRTHVPMKDIISSRISTTGYEDIYQYFKESGMPELQPDVIGKLWTAPFEEYPELNDWWLNKSSKTYQKYLITHPAYFFMRPFQYTNPFNKAVYLYLTPDLHFHEQVVTNKLQIIFTDLFLWVTSAFIFFMMLYIIKRKIPVNINNIMLPILLLFSGAILFLIIWHADLGELDRHLIQCAIMVRIGLIMSLMHLINTIVSYKWPDSSLVYSSNTP